MHIADILASTPTSFSFEFFPPRSEKGSKKLYESIRELESLAPSFVSVTYGAGGTTRELTHELVLQIQKRKKLDPIPHLTCIGHDEADISEILERYAKEGVSNILALAGDPPRDQPHYDRSQERFQHAADLVHFIRNFKNHPDKRGFGIGVAGFPEGHPATPNRLLEMDYLKAKVDEGADYICTQLFFDNNAFYDFCERCQLAGIKIPIIAGVMPITSQKGLSRMAELSGGTNFPAPLLKSIERCEGDAEAISRVGIHWATEQCRDLLDHEVDGIHFYTLNQSDATRQIYMNLGLKTSVIAKA